MLQPFRLEEPESIGEASALLARYGDSAKLYAGGTELLLVMKEGLLSYDYLVNIKGIPGIAEVAMGAGGLHIGAATTHAEVWESAVVQATVPPLAGSTVSEISSSPNGCPGGTGAPDPQTSSPSVASQPPPLTAVPIAPSWAETEVAGSLLYNGPCASRAFFCITKLNCIIAGRAGQGLTVVISSVRSSRPSLVSSLG